MHQELPCREMIPALIEKLQNEPGIALTQNRAQRLWERFEDGWAHFVVIDSQILGSAVIWHDSLRKDRESEYVELGTLWVHQQYRVYALSEIGSQLRLIAKGKKILSFCKHLNVARFIVMNPLIPVNSVANWKTCPPEVIASC